MAESEIRILPERKVCVLANRKICELAHQMISRLEERKLCVLPNAPQKSESEFWILIDTKKIKTQTLRLDPAAAGPRKKASRLTGNRLARRETSGSGKGKGGRARPDPCRP